MTTPDFLPQPSEADPRITHITFPVMSEREQKPEALIAADGGATVSKDPTDVEGRSNEDTLLRVEDKNVYAVFDGLGGHEDGKGASMAASQAIEDYFGDRLVPRTEDEAFRLMKGAMAAGREAVFTAGPNRLTTATITQMFEDPTNGPSVVIGHAGDTRAYILRDGHLRQVTRDQGEENRITNAFGGTDKAKAMDTSQDKVTVISHLQKGDRLMLCSDGITGDYTSEAYTNDELAAAVGFGTPRQAASELIKLSFTEMPGFIYQDEKGIYHSTDVDIPEYACELRSPKRDDKSVIVVEVGGASTTAEAEPESSTFSSARHHRVAPKLKPAFKKLSGVLIDPPQDLPKPERRVTRGFPDSQTGKVGYSARTLEHVFDEIRHPGDTSELMDKLVAAGALEESEMGYAANGTSLRDDIVSEVTKLVAQHDRLLQADPNQYNASLYQLGILLRSFKPLNKDLVSPIDWEKATSYYRGKGGDDLEKHQLDMASKFFSKVGELTADPRLKDNESVKKLTTLLPGIGEALNASAPWDGVEPLKDPKAHVESSRMLAIMNGDKGALLKGGKENVTFTAEEMSVIDYLAKRYKHVSNAGRKKTPNPDFINASGPAARARVMLAEELLDLKGIEEVLGTEIDPEISQLRPYRDYIQFRLARNRRAFRQRVYEEQILPRARVLGMSHDTLVALLRNDAGTQALMDLISNAASGAMKNNILIQNPPTPV